MKNLGIQYFTMRDIDRLGIQRVMEMTFDHLLTRLQIISNICLLTVLFSIKAHIISWRANR